MDFDWSNDDLLGEEHEFNDSARNFLESKKEIRPMFRSPQNSKFFHSLSITSIFSRLHGVLNVGKKISNYTV
jgi:hypothetical protein